MAIDSLVVPLLRVPLFQGLKPMQITEIARRADRIVYKPGEVIVKANSPIDAAVLIVSGEAVRMAGPGVSEEAELVPEGALVAEMTMLIETECTSTVVARTQVRALRISRAEMLAQMAEDPTVADHFIARISGRLSEFVDGLREIDRALSDGAEHLGGLPPLAAASAMAASAATLH